MARWALLVNFQSLTQYVFKHRAEELFEKGDKDGKLLAILTADIRANTVVPCIYSSEGTLVKDKEGIMQEFVSYYSGPYSPIPPYDTQVLIDLLDFLQALLLPDEVAASLDAPFTEKELATAVASFPNGKLPGPDGIPAESYK